MSMNERFRRPISGMSSRRRPRRGSWQVYWPTIKDRAYQYALLMRWHRPIGALLLLWPMMWAIWVAGAGHPDPRVVAIFIAGVWVMRSAGCVLNDLADRNFDPHVERTRDRPLAAGRVRPKEALAVAGVMLLIALGLVLMTNWLTFWLSFGAVGLAVLYPLMKRYTYFPQVFLGAAFGWAIPMGYAAQANALPPIAWLIFLSSIVWALIYDTQYAMVDREDDLKIGVKSTAILFGELDRHILGILQIVMMATLVLIGLQAHLGLWYYLSLVMASLLFGYQQVLTFERDRQKCFAAFMNNNWFGAIVFAGIVLDYWFMGRS